VIPSPLIERLVHDLVDRQSSEPIAGDLIAWLTESPRFRTFVEVHRDKIRKKLRTAPDAESLRDVRAELQVARLLLADRRVELVFEAYGAGKVGPDFTLTWPGSQSINLEVTRLRKSGDPGTLGGSVLTKLRQLQPARPNAILLALPDDAGDEAAIAAAVHALRRKADAKDEEFFGHRGFEGSRGFYDRFLRLSAVFVWSERPTGGTRAAAWINGSARIPIPNRALRVILALLRD
jgi:hypothetical protein